MPNAFRCPELARTFDSRFAPAVSRAGECLGGTPVPHPAARQECRGQRARPDRCENTWLEHKGRHIAMWTWGARSKEAPAVLLAHGWGGHAAQMRAFAFPLLQAGYRVITYDQPAHGVSEASSPGCRTSPRCSAPSPGTTAASRP
jgi:pimeloyl-ACP methyl ester carboxylesterase